MNNPVTTKVPQGILTCEAFPRPRGRYEVVCSLVKPGHDATFASHGVFPGIEAAQERIKEVAKWMRSNPGAAWHEDMADTASRESFIQRQMGHSRQADNQQLVSATHRSAAIVSRKLGISNPEHICPSCGAVWQSVGIPRFCPKCKKPWGEPDKRRNIMTKNPWRKSTGIEIKRVKVSQENVSQSVVNALAVYSGYNSSTFYQTRQLPDKDDRTHNAIIASRKLNDRDLISFIRELRFKKAGIDYDMLISGHRKNPKKKRKSLVTSQGLGNIFGGLGIFSIIPVVILVIWLQKKYGSQ